MATPCALLRALILALVLASVDLSTCHLLKASVSCLDCQSYNGLSGIKVAVECRHDMQRAMASTNDKGYFEAEIPSDSSDCFARLVGAPAQLCSYTRFMSSRVVKGRTSDNSYSYALSTPLSFLSSCPSTAEPAKDGKPKKGSDQFGSSKTFDIPMPSYLPFFPIIGIP